MLNIPLIWNASSQAKLTRFVLRNQNLYGTYGTAALDIYLVIHIEVIAML